MTNKIMYDVLTKFLSSIVNVEDFNIFFLNIEDFLEIKIGNVYIRKNSLILIFSSSPYKDGNCTSMKIFLHYDDEGITSKETTLDFDFSIIKDLLDPHLDKMSFSLVHRPIYFSESVKELLKNIDADSEKIRDFLITTNNKKID